MALSGPFRIFKLPKLLGEPQEPGHRSDRDTDTHEMSALSGMRQLKAKLEVPVTRPLRWRVNSESPSAQAARIGQLQLAQPEVPLATYYL